MALFIEDLLMMFMKLIIKSPMNHGHDGDVFLHEKNRVKINAELSHDSHVWVSTTSIGHKIAKTTIIILDIGTY